MIVKLLTKHNLEFLSLTGVCRGSPKSRYVKMPHCWKSHATALQPPVKLRNTQMVFSQWLNTYRIFTRLAKALIRLRVCPSRSKALLVAHITLLEISCHGSIMSFVCQTIQAKKQFLVIFNVSLYTTLSEKKSMQTYKHNQITFYLYSR